MRIFFLNRQRHHPPLSTIKSRTAAPSHRCRLLWSSKEFGLTQLPNVCIINREMLSNHRRQRRRSHQTRVLIVSHIWHPPHRLHRQSIWQLDCFSFFFFSRVRRRPESSRWLIDLIVVGHVDAGKSTLTGHLLYELALSISEQISTGITTHRQSLVHVRVGTRRDRWGTETLCHYRYCAYETRVARCARTSRLYSEYDHWYVVVYT